MIGQAPPGSESAPGPGKEAGDQPGADYYEADVTVDDLAELIFEDLQLPQLKPKVEAELTVEDIRFNDIRRKGMMGNIDKRRTLIEAVKRRALTGYASGGDAAMITNDDLRFKT